MSSARKSTPFKPGQKKVAPASSAVQAAAATPSKHRQTLAAQIAALSNPTPRDFNPDEEDATGLTNNGMDKHDNDDEDEYANTSRLMRSVRLRTYIQGDGGCDRRAT